MNNDLIICKKCLYSSYHPLGIEFNDGVCTGCQIFQEKNSIDWQERWAILKRLVGEYKSRDGNYDCIVPVSGAGDSYFITHTVKNILGLNPLLVSNNKYFNTSLGIKNLANLRTQFDADILFQNINPNSVKKVTRETFYQFGSIYWPVIAGQTAFPTQTAIRLKIPLIIWGAHQGLEQVGMFSHLDEVEMSRWYRKNHDLMGHEADDLINTSNLLREEDIWQFRYPTDFDINRCGVRGIYLGNFIRWDPWNQHQAMSKIYGYRAAKMARTFDVFDHIDCYNYLNMHDWLKFMKHGYSKVTDHVCREIRHGRLTRSNGMKIIRKFEILNPQYLDLFCEWLDIREETLPFLVDQFRSTSNWEQVDRKHWQFQGPSTYFGKDDSDIIIPEVSETSISPLAIEPDGPGYITVGKGW